MKKWITILFLFIAGTTFAQRFGKIEYIRMDSALSSQAYGDTSTLVKKFNNGTYYFRLVRNPVDSTDAVNLRSMQDTLELYVLYSDSTITFITPTQLTDSLTIVRDSIANHTVRYYGIIDSLIRHTANYYTLQDTVIQNMADIAALETGDDHIENDTYFTGINNAGDTANVWKINQDNNFELGIPWLLESQNSEADAGIIYRNIPLRNLNYGDSVGFRDRAGGFELWKAWGIVDGSDGLASVGLTVNGTLLADNVSGTNTGDQDLSTLRDSVGNNMDSIANHTVRYYAVLDSLARHTVDYYTLQDSVTNNMDSIVTHTTRYYGVLDSLIRHSVDYYTLQDTVTNNMDSIVNHTTRYYGVLDSLARHTVDYYTLQDSVINSMDSIVNHTTRYYGVLDSLIRHSVDYYTLQDTVINNMDSIVAHTVRYYGVIDSLVRHTVDYYTLQDSVINSMDSIVNHTVRYYGVLDSLARHSTDYYTLQDSVITVWIP